ncbi:retrovirus-related Pol polyprotein from transposon 297-like protein [Dinothrombium tinctorium]|nr:retrovirus-related Pol polyprotein from transposon 297-like protein [Dinothrombium tinctorium]RWS10138.1 retrovirus-related Pol polyprotein from transposon 297-like protein [Dinothrombium tinctorium]
MNRTLVPMIASMCKREDGKDWDQHICNASIALNSHVNKSTGKPPFEIMYGFQPRTKLDREAASIFEEDNDNDVDIEGVREQAHGMITRAQARQKAQFDKQMCSKEV